MSNKIDIDQDALNFILNILGEEYEPTRKYSKFAVKPSEKIVCEYIKYIFENKTVDQATKKAFVDRYIDESYDNEVRSFEDFKQVGTEFFERIKSEGSKSQHYLAIRCIFLLNDNKFAINFLEIAYKEALLSEELMQ